MKIKTKEQRTRFDTVRGNFISARDAYGEKLSLLERHMNQYKGSKEIDGGESATTVRNITYEIIESQISSDIPSPKVDPACYSEVRTRRAESIERLLSSLRDRLPYEELNDVDERYTYIYGASVWYAEWDDTIRHGRERGGVRLQVVSPTSFIPQPDVARLEDMDYCFITLETSEGELCRKWGATEEELALAEHLIGGGDTDGVLVTVAFYKDPDGEVGKLVFSGELLLEDSPRLYSRRISLCSKCKSSPDACECERPSYEWKIDSGEEIEVDGVRVSVPYYTPKSFPIVIRKNTSVGEELLGQSDCEFLRPQQQSVNKIESRILQKLLRAGVTPIVPEDATVVQNNSVFGQLIRIKPGESASQYGKVDTTPDVSQDIIEAERLYDQAKRTLGISDAYQGISSKSESGYARELQISQASGRLTSKRKMKHTAYAALDRIIFELYLAFADEPRRLVYRDAYGRVHNADFSKYAFLESAPGEDYFYDDDYLFSVDLNGGVEYQREALWQRNLENLKAGTLGSPDSPITLLRYWQCQERAHYPHARENVEYFTLALEEEKRKEAPYEHPEGIEAVGLY